MFKNILESMNESEDDRRVSVVELDVSVAGADDVDTEGKIEVGYRVQVTPSKSGISQIALFFDQPIKIWYVVDGVEQELTIDGFTEKEIELTQGGELFPYKLEVWVKDGKITSKTLYVQYIVPDIIV